MIQKTYWAKGLIKGAILAGRAAFPLSEEAKVEED